MRPIKDEIETLLDPYIDACLGYGPPGMRHWWCDGVICLHLSLLSARSIKLLGVAWIDASQIAPFEIDVELDPASERWFSKTLFRIGILDRAGQPTLLPYDRHTDHVLTARPRRNSDWAIAVELTPPPDGTGDSPAQ